MTTSTIVDIGTLVTCTPGVYGGRPCLAGTRYPIIGVAEHYNAGWPAELIADRFTLPLHLVYAGLTYYLANKEALDIEIEETNREAERMQAEDFASAEFQEMLELARRRRTSA